MRSIIKKKNTDRSKQIVLGLVLVVVMIFSVLGYAFQGETTNSNQRIIYNSYEFINQNSYWYTEIGDFKFLFRYNPNQVERIPTKELDYLNSYSNKPLYVFSESIESETEIYKNLWYNNRIVERMQKACLSQEECSDNSPIKTCEDNFIIIKESNETTISQNKSCVFISGPKQNLTMITDEFLFNILNIN